MKNKTEIKFNILAILCIIVFCFAATPITLQNDTFYTIKIGEHITQNGIDMQDPFSWHEDLPYTYPHWLYDLATYGIYHFFGMTGIYVATVILCCILGVLMYITCSKLTKNKLISFIITILSIFALKGFIAARAQLVTYILFVLEIYFIEMFLENKKKRYGIGLFILSLIIANIHVAVWPFFFVVFLPYIVEYIIKCVLDFHIIHRINLWSLDSEIKKYNKKGNQDKVKELEEKKEKAIIKFDKFKEKQKNANENPYRVKIKKRDGVKWLILIMIICALAGLLTPIGDTPYTYLVKTMQGKTTQSISEHQPIVFDNNKYALCAVALFLIILIFTDTKIELKDLFMIAGLTYMMIMSQRQFSLLIVIGFFILARLISAFVDKYDKNGTNEFITIMTTWIGKIATILVIVCLAYLMGKDKLDDKIIDESNYPVGAAEYIKENLDLDNIKLYNEYNYGSYLLFQGIPVFIDSRADLYDTKFSGKEEDIFSDFITVSSVNTYYEDIFNKYGFTHLILKKDTRLNIFISRDENYKELYSDDNFVVYERLIQN